MVQKIPYYYYFLGILLFAIFLRLFKFQEFAMFGHDSSRDVILTYKMFTLGEIIYRGPVFSVIWGNLSPLYYYLIAPFHYFLNFHPLSSAIFANFLNVLYVAFVMYAVKRVFCMRAAIFAGLLASASALIITNAGSGLNPSMTPFFAIGAYYFLARFLIDEQVNKPETFFKKIPFLNRAKYLSLVLFSMCISFVFALHPSGVFFLPFLIIIFAINRPKVDIWSVLLAVGLFSVLFVMPYLIQEKKMAWWTVKQVIDYFQDREPSGITFPEKFAFFIDSVFRNTSLLLFGEVVKHYIFYTLPIFVMLTIDTIRGVLKFNKLGHKSLLAVILFSYLLTFVLLVPVEEGDFKRQWFGASFIPLLVVYTGVLISDIAHKKFFYVGYGVLFLILTFNIRFISEFKGSSDSYFHRKEIAEFLRTETNGADFDIYGENPEPLYYILWYGEKDLVLKEEYRSWFVWAKGRKSDLMYLVSDDPDNSTSVKNYSTKENVYTTSLGYQIIKFTK